MSVRLRVLEVFCWTYLLAMLAGAAVVLFGNESLSLNSLVLFAPRWPWLVPLVVLAPLVLLWRRRASVPLLAAAIAWAGCLSGFVVAWPAHDPGPGEGRLRVLTINMQGGYYDYAPLAAYLDQVQPDIVLLQEWEQDRHQDRFPGDNWHFARSGELSIASRYEVVALEGLTRDELPLPGAVSGFGIRTPAGLVKVFNVHLPTVRPGLYAVMTQGRRGLPELRATNALRDLTSATVRDYCLARADPADLVVGGDFNAPAKSSVYARHWGRFDNAFEEGGAGFGATKFTRWHGVRIDHVVHGSNWRTLYAATGPPIGSDHRPVLAVLERAQ